MLGNTIRWAPEDEGVVDLHRLNHGTRWSLTPIMTRFTTMTASLTADLMNGTLEPRRIALRCFCVLACELSSFGHEAVVKYQKFMD